MIVRVFAYGSRDLASIPGRVIPKAQKWYLMPLCLTLSNIRQGSRVKWSNPEKGVSPSPTPWCNSYRKGSLRVTLDYGISIFGLLPCYIHNVSADASFGLHQVLHIELGSPHSNPINHKQVQVLSISCYLPVVWIEPATCRSRQ